MQSLLRALLCSPGDDEEPPGCCTGAAPKNDPLNCDCGCAQADASAAVTEEVCSILRATRERGLAAAGHGGLPAGDASRIGHSFRDAMIKLYNGKVRSCPATAGHPGKCRASCPCMLMRHACPSPTRALCAPHAIAT